MKINHQENCEYRSSSIVIDLIDFHRSYQFFLFRFNFSDKLNGQDITFDRDKRKEIKENFKSLEPFSLN